MRQEIQLLGGKLKMITLFLKKKKQKTKNKNEVISPIGYPTASKQSKPNMIDPRIYTPQTTCQCACENQIETAISHVVKESNITQFP
jgi:hypothetical protein